MSNTLKVRLRGTLPFQGPAASIRMRGASSAAPDFAARMRPSKALSDLEQVVLVVDGPLKGLTHLKKVCRRVKGIMF